MSGLVKRYGELVAVDHLDLTVERGETFALLGPNGAGKTSTIEICEGFRHPDGGSVRVLGLDPHRDATKLKRRVGMMLQAGGVYPLATPAEMVKLFASFHHDSEDPDELIERVGLGEHRKARFRNMSGGQQQRLKLALALVGKPEIVFLDEPSAGLDPAARRLTWDLVRGLRDRGVTVVLTTHLLDEAELLADRVGIIDAGKLVALGTPQALTHGDHAEVLFTARAGLDLAGIRTAVGAPTHEDQPGRYRIEAINSPQLVSALAGWLADHDVHLGVLEAGKRSLEDVFLRLTGPPEAAATPEPSLERAP